MLVGELSRDVRPQRRVAFLSPVAVDGKASRGTWSRDLVTCRTHEQSLSLQRSAAEVTGDSTSWHEQQGQDRFSSFQVLSLFPPPVCMCVCVCSCFCSCICLALSDGAAMREMLDCGRQ